MEKLVEDEYNNIRIRVEDEYINIRIHTRIYMYDKHLRLQIQIPV